MDGGQGNPKVILITGTSSGIGLELAVELAKRGARVFASMRDVDKAEALQSAATSAGVAVEVVALDVTSEESVVEALARVESAAGRIDVVVNNAAVTTYGPIEFTPQASVETMFATNIIGAIRVVRAVLPGMRRQGSGLHRRQRVRSENRRVDRRVVFDDVPFNLIEDDVTPNRDEAVESGDREEKIAKGRRVQDACVENDALTFQR